MAKSTTVGAILDSMNNPVRADTEAHDTMFVDRFFADMFAKTE